VLIRECRQPTSFRDKITADGSSGYKAEAGRYDDPTPLRRE
jgi:glutathionyl-hydroquinone reductase